MQSELRTALDLLISSYHRGQISKPKMNNRHLALAYLNEEVNEVTLEVYNDGMDRALLEELIDTATVALRAIVDLELVASRDSTGSVQISETISVIETELGHSIKHTPSGWIITQPNRDIDRVIEAAKLLPNFYNNSVSAAQEYYTETGRRIEADSILNSTIDDICD